MAVEVPIPPFDLSARLVHGSRTDAARAEYLEQGARSLAAIESLLPDGWSWSEKTVLDFGCGAGRVLRHLAERAPEAELWGSDIDPGCIAWNDEQLSPPVRFVLNEELPPLPLPSEKFDLVYALSVFTHLSTHWAGWLCDLRRVLAPGGLLIATIMSEGMSEAIAGEPWAEAEVGMRVYEAGQSWQLGGPMILHSPWWVQEHWGRLFEIEELCSRGFQAVEAGEDDHGVVLRRRREEAVSVEELERVDPNDPREARALQRDVLHLRAEVEALRGGSDRVTG